MEPAPVGVEDDLAGRLGHTSGRGTLLPGQGWMSLGSEGANLLTKGHAGEGEGEEGRFCEHCQQQWPMLNRKMSVKLMQVGLITQNFYTRKSGKCPAMTIRAI